MKYFDLNNEEEQLLDEFEKGKFKAVENELSEKSRYQRLARESLNKSRNVNIRITEVDFQKLKAASIEEGIPYQTLISSLIRKYTRGKLSFK